MLGCFSWQHILKCASCAQSNPNGIREKWKNVNKRLLSSHGLHQGSIPVKLDAFAAPSTLALMQDWPDAGTLTSHETGFCKLKHVCGVDSIMYQPVFTLKALHLLWAS